MKERWVVLCPECGGACLHQEVARPPATWMTLWSDQYIQGAPGPQWERLAHCAHCHAWMWLDAVDTEPWNPTEFTTLPMLAPPMTLADWFEALEQGAAEDPEQRHYLYRQIWVQGNHLRREAASVAFHEVEPAWRKALEDFLPQVDDPRLRLELLRELGQFEAALAACHDDLEPEWREAQRARCQAQDTRPFVVRQVPV